MKKIVLIFTGGTIAMKILSKSLGVVSGMTSFELVETLKKLGDCDNVVLHEFSDMPSPSMTPHHMYELKRVVDQYLDNQDYAGAIIVHGTDTLEETAFYLDVLSSSEKPVVLTGSMKNASELGYDGLTNLVSSVKVVMDEDSKGKGVLVVMNYTINAACEVTKTHTLNLDTFKSLEFGPLGIIDGDDVIYFRSQTQRKIYPLDNAFCDSVYLVKAYTGLDGKIIDYYYSQGAKGLVIEALGRGNLPPTMMESIQAAIKGGMLIVVVSRCYSGRVLDTYGYIGGGKDLKKAGCIFSQNLSGPKARLLLMIAIGNKLNSEAIKTIIES